MALPRLFLYLLKIFYFKMVVDFLSNDPLKLQQRITECLITQDYAEAINLYEQVISLEPEVKSNYWHLGLIFLLQGQEEEAQTTWLLAMTEGSPSEIDEWTTELTKVLKIEANRREQLGEYSVAWAIRQHLREINPADINNLLYLIWLFIELETYTGKELEELEIISLLQQANTNVEVDLDLLMHVVPKVLTYAPRHPSSLEFVEACLAHIKEPLAFIDILIPLIFAISYSGQLQRIGIGLGELGLRLAPHHLELLRALGSLYAETGQYSKAIETSKLCYSLVEELPDQVYANHLILLAVMSAGGYWESVGSHIKEHDLLLKSLLEKKPALRDSTSTLRLYNTSFFLPYFRDQAEANQTIRNQLAKFCQSQVEADSPEAVERYRRRHNATKIINRSAKPLKIGYLSHCLRRHSVGWLARWLFHYCDLNRFEIYTYMMACQQRDDPLLQWYVNHSTKAYKLGLDTLQAAEQIYKDEVDILIDLDSITINLDCGIMALKPAPVQVTWLGWDASGIPTIDYYIADPYVLPESAQDYYTAEIWRLPQTYIAVDGFEVGVPSLRRSDLDIPSEAVVYLSVQKGFKYNPQMARMHMDIVKEVPNSYLLIKGWGEQEPLEKFFIQMAEEQGLDGNRLRFLPGVALEETHRANLGIADVVLDTYPYNGATTTMETLWMCIPLVTRVGQQFASRNSYTMMVNAGVTEGIAWTDEEYVEWGIRLGKDTVLRQQISWKLRQSRQTAPLWNAKQFTREMEKAYEQMWQRYLDSHD